ncbi:2-hydroxyacid dehydrogenase [Halalkalibacter urbisdiaboli]|uniref:2-hydroxyacid dehydrogenase n=1 Tax=Halalkalibacter urbisdiaboli TaxID=1960589 RepID=UPI000B44BAD4|nr:D-glycerate dehydrogenase [Halalkalibacter urbisdiaboli]
MKKNIIVTVPIPEDVQTYLQQYCEIKKLHPRAEDLHLHLPKAEGLLTSGLAINDSLLDNAPQLKVVSNKSVGYNNFDINAMKKREVIGTHTPFVLDNTVADLVLGLMLSVARRIPELDQYVKQGLWTKSIDQQLFGTDVHGATLGMIGMGRIGEVIAKRAIHGFNMNTIYYNRNRKEEVEKELGVKYRQLDELLQSADFVVLMTPLTKDTYQFFGKKQFSLMKGSAFFINASRGATVDEPALIEALETGQIRGAGLDVFEKEPVDVTNPLLKMEQVVTLPHIGSATLKTREEMAWLAARNLVHALTGKGSVYRVV